MPLADAVPPATAACGSGLRPEMFGSAAFRADYGLRYAYLTGAMYKGISSAELVIAMGRAGMMGYLGTGGMSLVEIERDIDRIQTALGERAWGANLLANQASDIEERTVALYLARGVRKVEASSYMQLSESVVRYRVHGLHRDPQGRVVAPNRVMAKISRPEVALQFMSPPPERIVRSLVEKGLLTAAEAALAHAIPMAQEICVESDSGGHTDQGVLLAQLPAFLAMRDRLQRAHGYAQPLSVGAAGGLGTPHALLGAFMTGADFVVTGSINQCTVEAGTSDAVKDILAGIDIQDTGYAPAGDLFELGAKVQVVRKGLLFASRANKLYELFCRYGALDELPADTVAQLESKYFRRPIAAVWDETREYLLRTHPRTLETAESNPKQKLALVLRWYFVHSARLARAGDEAQRVDFQIHCGPAMGAFNHWVRDTPLADWRNRRVGEIGARLMEATAALLDQRLRNLEHAR